MDKHHSPSPLSTANAEVVELLLSIGGADPNLLDFADGRAPLGHAACERNVDVVELLLAHESIDPNRCDFFGNSALGWVQEHQHHEIAELIRSHPRCNGKLSSGPVVSSRKASERREEFLVAERRGREERVAAET